MSIIIYGTEAYNKFVAENRVKKISENDLKNIQKKSNELSGFTPVCKIVTQYHFEKYSEKEEQVFSYQYYLHSYTTVLEYQWYHLRPFTHHYLDKTYSLSFAETNDHPYLKSFSLPKELREEPQRIGKATTLKMEKWLKYLLKIEKLKEEHIQKKEEEIQAYKELLKPYEHLIQWEQRKVHGTINRGGFIFDLWIYPDGHTNQRLSLSDKIKVTPQNFIDLSDNFYLKENSEILVLYSCNTWHSKDSMQLISVFSSKEKLNRYLKGFAALGNLQTRDLIGLMENNQTQGLEVNYLIESVPLNILFKRQ